MDQEIWKKWEEINVELRETSGPLPFWGSALQGPFHLPQESLKKSQSREVVPHFLPKEASSFSEKDPGKQQRLRNGFGNSQRFLDISEWHSLAAKCFHPPKGERARGGKRLHGHRLQTQSLNNMWIMQLCNVCLLSAGRTCHLLLTSNIWQRQWDITPVVMLFIEDSISLVDSLFVPCWL